MSTLTKGRYFLGILLLTLSLAANAQTPTVSIVPGGPVVCAGTQLNTVITNLDPPYTYQWSNGDTTASITLNQSAFIRVRVRGFAVGGATQRQVTSSWTPYLVIPNPTASVSPTGPLRLCPNETTTLDANGGFFFSTYAWNTGATTSSILVDQTGTYQVTITNSFFTCTTASTSNMVDVEVMDASYQPAITADGPTTVCKPGYVPLHTDGGFSSYQWSTGDSTQSVNILMNGLQLGPIPDTLVVTLTVGLNNLCTFSNNNGIELRSIRQPRLRTTDCGNMNLTVNDSIKSDLVLSYGGFIPQYEFEFEETTNPNTTWTLVSNSRWCDLADVTPALEPMKFYNVRVRAIIDGIPFCYGNYCQIGIVADPFTSQGSSRLATSGSTLDASVFPNPSSDEFQLVLRNLNSDDQALVHVNDVSGRLISTFTVDSNAGAVRFGSELNTGIYLVTVRQGDNQITTRIVKTH